MKMGNNYYELDTFRDSSGTSKIRILAGDLSQMSKTTQIHASGNPRAFLTVSVYSGKFEAAVQSYQAGMNGKHYYMGSYFRDCRNLAYDTIRESRVK